MSNFSMAEVNLRGTSITLNYPPLVLIHLTIFI